MDSISDFIFGTDSGESAAAASVEGAEISAAAQREALDYLKEVEALPQEFREQALTRLAGFAGLPGGEGEALQLPGFAGQEELISRAQQSPLYEEILGGRQAGEESILRQASATGGLRSGNVQSNLYDYNVQLQNQALTQAYNQAFTEEQGAYGRGLTEFGVQSDLLSGLAGTPSGAQTIAGYTAGIGATQAQGVTGAAQAREVGQQQSISNLLGLGEVGTEAYAAFSDIRLKENIEYRGIKNGHQWYAWDWKENDFDLIGTDEGVMAHEVYEYMPDAIGAKNGFITVDYEKLGLI